MKRQTALVVEDTDANRDFFERLLTQARFDVQSSSTGKDALSIADHVGALDLAVIDMQLDDIGGLELTTRLRRNHPETCVIIATMHDEASLMESAFLRGCNVFLVKPHGFMELFTRLTTEGVESMRDGDPLIIDHYGPRHYHHAVLT